MEETRIYIENLFSGKGIAIPDNLRSVFNEFTLEAENVKCVSQIQSNQNYLMNKWKIRARIDEIKAVPFKIPNGTENKQYSAIIDYDGLGLSDLSTKDFKGLEDIGLRYNFETGIIEGIPSKKGDFKITFIFNVVGEDLGTEAHERLVTFVVNPDPKTLWKNIPSDRNSLYWKEDDCFQFGELGEKKIVVASNRGRSHENNGTFRDDDFAFKYFNKSGWSIVALSDGAGSSSLSRKGSNLSCESVISFFEDKGDISKILELEEKLLQYAESNAEEHWKEVEILAKQNLYKATVFVHNELKTLAEDTFKKHPELFDNPKAKGVMDYFHSTLIFACFKKYDFGYFILTFGVGDCPIAIVNKEINHAEMLNWLDVGEFGGGTRFITQAEIFHSSERPMASRFNVKLIKDFSYMFLMTDGIYDPKFVVEANLEKTDKWLEFIEDLKGKNEDKKSIDFENPSAETAEQLSSWMDFWSQGNHDDRTLAIVF